MTLLTAMRQLFLGQTDGLDKFKVQELMERRERALKMIEGVNGTLLMILPQASPEGEFVGETFFYEVNGTHLSSLSTVTSIQSFCAHGKHVDELLPKELTEYLVSRRKALRELAQGALDSAG